MIRIGILMFVTSLSAAAETPADGAKPLRAAASPNKRFMLRIQPGRVRGDRVVRPRAVLSQRGEKNGRTRKMWRGKLANDVAPMHVMIRNDGRFVVTLDEHQRGGAAHALVIYDQRGRILRQFDLRELLSGDDWKHVKIRRRAVEWLPGAKFMFAEKRPEFVIQLIWGREIRIDLENPGRTGPAESGEEKSVKEDDRIPPEILALLEARAAVADEDARTPTSAPVDAAALEMFQQIAAVFGLDLDLAEAAVGARADSELEQASRTDGGGMRDFSIADYGGAADYAVPLPDPANPVDYVGWVLEQTEIVGEGAGPLYEAAFAQYQEFEGDQAILEDAMSGDPAALASPEIASWLAMHENALELFHAAPQLEYRGMLTVGEDRSVVGLLLPNLSQARRLARLSLVQAKRLEDGGEFGAAMDNYANTLAVGAQMSQGPTIIENLVGAAIQRETAFGMLDSFAADEDGSIDYAQAAERLERDYRPLRPMAEVLAGEPACCFDILQRVYEPDPTTGQYRVSDEGVKWLSRIFDEGMDGGENPAADAEFRAKLEAASFESMVTEANRYYGEVFDAYNMPFQEARRALSAAEERISTPEYQEQYPLFAGLLPALSRANHAAADARATRNAARLVAHLKAYRRQNGVYPESLDVFGDSDMIVDPFTGGPFVYRTAADDFTLYSLGGNGVDDGGTHRRRGYEGDVRYWPPPRDE